MDSNGQFSDIGCLPAKSLPQLRRNAALAMAALAKGGCVRIADIDVHRTEGPLCSLGFESERYGPHAYHGDDIAF
jgi:hypothetical protein